MLPLLFDATQLKKYSPVSNLSLLSKLIERVVEQQLQMFLNSSTAIPEHRTAHRQFNSAKTASTKLFNEYCSIATVDRRQQSACWMSQLRLTRSIIRQYLLG